MLGWYLRNGNIKSTPCKNHAEFDYRCNDCQQANSTAITRKYGKIHSIADNRCGGCGNCNDCCM